MFLLKKRHCWDESFKALKDCIKEDGSFPDVYNGINLKNWVNNQKTIHNNGKMQEDGSYVYETKNGVLILTKEQVDNLNSLPIIWKERITWEKHFAALEKCINEDGTYPDEYEGIELKNWGNQQKKVYNKGKKQQNGDIIHETTKNEKLISEKLTKEHVDKLNSLPFVWRKFRSWDDYFKALKDCIGEDGTYPYKYMDIDLEKWGKEQRLYHNSGKKQKDGSYVYKTKEGNRILTKKHVDELDSINFIWDIKEYNWQKKFNLFLEYLDENNGEYPTSKLLYKEEDIGPWITLQRNIYSKGVERKDGSIIYNGNILTKKHIDLLDSKNFVWFGDEVQLKAKKIKDKKQMIQIQRFLLYKMKFMQENNISGEELNKELMLIL